MPNLILFSVLGHRVWPFLYLCKLSKFFLRKDFFEYFDDKAIFELCKSWSWFHISFELGLCLEVNFMVWHRLSNVLAFISCFPELDLVMSLRNIFGCMSRQYLAFAHDLCCKTNGTQGFKTELRSLWPLWPLFMVILMNSVIFFDVHYIRFLSRLDCTRSTIFFFT